MRRIHVLLALSLLLVGYVVLAIIKCYDIYGVIISVASMVLSMVALFIPISKEIEFKETDWEDNGDGAIMIITESMHKLGKKVTCELYELHPRYGYQMVLCDVYINSGNITLEVGKNCEFDGKIVVRG